MTKVKDQYAELGVSSGKKGVHKAVSILDPGLFQNAFCRVFPDVFTGSPDYCLITHSDGTGTKTALGYLVWKETGDMYALADLTIDAIVMNLDDMICVGATGPFTFTQTIDRNSFVIPDDAIAAIIGRTKKFFDDMRLHGGIDITYSGGETADVNDVVRTLTINATMQARMLRKDVIEANIKPGMIIVGLASFGSSNYERSIKYNSGIGSNGLTMARHKLLGPIYQDKYPETYAPELQAKGKAYTGEYSVTKPVHIKDGFDMILGALALSPTRTYAPVIKEFLYQVPRSHIGAIIHCSGGGQTKCLKFADGVHIVKDNMFPVPPLFTLIQEESGETWKNMYKTFNMGHRMEVYCASDAAAARLIHISKEEYGIDAQIIGRTEPSEETTLTIRSQYGEFEYKKEDL